MNDKIISVEGESFALTPEFQELACVFESGRVLIAKDKINDPYLISLKARASRMFGDRYELQQVSVAEIRDIYFDHNKRGVSGEAAAKHQMQKMQKEAIRIFESAVKSHASDIHIRVEGDKATILYRINGDLKHISEMPSNHALQLCQSIYVSLTDVSETTFKLNARQDARISDPEKLPLGLHGLRISTTPTVGEMLMVLRLLYSEEELKGDLMSLGYGDYHIDSINLMMSQPYGINIISGPTGSGKSTTLQHVLAMLFEQTQGTQHIITVEDPPEYPIKGAVQTPVVADNVNQRAEAYRAAMRSLMRLDPDIIMIGEIRDRDTAQAAIDMSMTGHQVWTTLHANNAFAIINRLTEIGLSLGTICDPNLITGLIAQRLVKRLCPHCKVPLVDAERDGLITPQRSYRVRKACREDISSVYVRKPNGCARCSHSGLLGRTVVSETVTTDQHMFDLILDGRRHEAIKYWQEELNGIDLRAHGIMKVKSGITDPEDTERIVGLLHYDRPGEKQSRTNGFEILQGDEVSA